MVDSINTNAGALSALSNLNSSRSSQASTLDRISSGIISRSDNAANVAIATELNAESAGLSAVSNSLDNASSIANITLAAGQSIADTLLDLNELAVRAADPGLDSDSAAALDAQFQSTLGTLEGIVGATEFAGQPLLTGEGEITAITSPDASSSVAIDNPDLRLGGPTVTIDSSFSLADPASAQAAVLAIGESLENVNATLTEVGATADAFANAQDFTQVLSDTIEVGVGNLIDVDLGEAAANQAADEVAVELGVIAANIANQAPESLLQLFDSSE